LSESSMLLAGYHDMLDGFEAFFSKIHLTLNRSEHITERGKANRLMSEKKYCPILETRCRATYGRRLQDACYLRRLCKKI